MNEEKNASINKLVDNSVLASPPDLLFKIINSLDSELSSHQIGEIVGHDQTVSAQVLKLSNSSFFGFKGEIKTLDRSINILGTKTVRNIAVTTLLFSHTNKIRLYNLDIMQFWLQSFLVADITREICQQAGLDGDEGYIAGLLHYIGKLILYAQKQEANNLFKEPHTPSQVLEFEKENWSVDSVELSTILLRKWNIPEDTVKAISQHRRPGGQSKLGNIVFLANIFANIVTDDNFICDLNRSQYKTLLEKLEIDEKEFLRMCVALPNIVERGKLIMKVMSKKQAKPKRRRTFNKVSLVTPREFSLAKCLLELLAFQVEMVPPKLVAKIQENMNQAQNLLDEEETEEEKPEKPAAPKAKKVKKLGFFDKISNIFAPPPPPKPEPDEEEKPKEKPPSSWNPLVIFEDIPAVKIDKLTITTYQIENEENKGAENTIPLFFSNANLDVK